MDAPYYLPLSVASAEAFFEHRKPFEEPIEAAAMFSALTCLQKPMSHVVLDRMVRDSLPVFRKNPEVGLCKLIDLAEEIEIPDSRSFLEKLYGLGVVISKLEHIKKREWLAPDGSYSKDFQKRCASVFDKYEITFDSQEDSESDGIDIDGDLIKNETRRAVRISSTTDQFRVMKIVASAPGEHVAIDAYAGTGKTFLVGALSEGLRGGFTYVAPHKTHLYGFVSAMSKRGGKEILATTFFELAAAIARQHLYRTGPRFYLNIGRSEVPAAQQALRAGIEAVGADSPADVLKKAKRIIDSWCSSDDAFIDERHLMRSGVHCRSDFNKYIAATTMLWNAMFSISDRQSRIFDISTANLVKWLVVSGAEIPSKYGTFLVDEAHDLSLAWRNLFVKYSGGCILMGDPHQRLRGSVARHDHAKYAVMTTSVRIGLGVQDAIERTLGMAPQRTMPEFRSSGDHLTRPRYYSSIKEAPMEGLRLYGNEWALLEGALRLKSSGVSFNILPASKRMMENVVRDGLATFCGREVSRGISVGGYANWEQLADNLYQRGLSSIVRMFEKGFSEHKLAELLAYEQAAGNKQATIGLIDHAKNLEFDSVVLAPCCYEDASRLRGFQPVHASYLGMTRARNELWIPGDSFERLFDLQVKM